MSVLARDGVSTSPHCVCCVWNTCRGVCISCLDFLVAQGCGRKIGKKLFVEGLPNDIAFADCAPFLVTTEESLADLNARLASPVSGLGAVTFIAGGNLVLSRVTVCRSVVVESYCGPHAIPQSWPSSPIPPPSCPLHRSYCGQLCRAGAKHEIV